MIQLDQQLASEVKERFLTHLEKRPVKLDQPSSSHKHSRPAPGSTKNGLGRRVAVFLYGLVCYAIFFGTFLYAAGFVGNLFVPKSIDSEPQTSLPRALLTNVLLLGIFAVQHSLMARPFFKQRWTKIVPKEVERSTYVLFASLALILMFWQWQPMGGVIWNVQDPVARGILLTLFAVGWLLVLAATFLINHFDLFGLRQVTFYLLGKEYAPLRFRTPVLYKLVRHPLYLGFLIAFWSSPTMTAAHLVFAIATTAYILLAIQFEERDLLNEHGKSYENYRQRVPMLIPSAKKNAFQDALN